MLNLKSLILLALISFTLQINNCLLQAEGCLAKEVKIPNCKVSYVYFSDENNQNIRESCRVCESGFALSYDETGCVSIDESKIIPNCINHYFDKYEEEEVLLCDECQNDYALSDEGDSCIGIKNCYIAEDNECYQCKPGYAVSYDGKSCIQSQTEHCIWLARGNSGCEICDNFFLPNTKGKCEKTLCSESEDNNIHECSYCFEGYYLEGNECKKIEIENCIELDEDNEDNCLYCVDDEYSYDGKCNTPINGCEEEEDNGKCSECGINYKKTTDNTCEFKGCPDGSLKFEICEACKAGYYPNFYGNVCIGYEDIQDSSSGDSSSGDSSPDSSSGNKIQYALLILLLATLI